MKTGKPEQETVKTKPKQNISPPSQMAHPRAITKSNQGEREGALVEDEGLMKGDKQNEMKVGETKVANDGGRSQTTASTKDHRGVDGVRSHSGNLSGLTSLIEMELMEVETQVEPRAVGTKRHQWLWRPR